MDIIKQCRLLLNAYGCSDSVVESLSILWNDPKRTYHNIDHLNSVIEKINSEGEPFIFDDNSPDSPLSITNISNGLNILKFNLKAVIMEKSDLIVAAIFHDAIYDVHSKTNEEDSAELFEKMCVNVPEENKKRIVQAILDTKHHAKTSSDFSMKLVKADLDHLANGDLGLMIEDERRIFREYGFVDFEIYKPERLRILASMRDFIYKINPNSHYDYYIEWFRQYQPKIAVYSGSFNPFHLGHLNILKKAEKIFDKVIIAIGRNTDKEDQNQDQNRIELSKILPNNQVDVFDTFLHEYAKNKKYPISAIVKGLRNSTDFDFEKKQLRYMEDMMPNINVHYIIGDRQFEHISSRDIRSINRFDNKESKKYLP